MIEMYCCGSGDRDRSHLLSLISSRLKESDPLALSSLQSEDDSILKRFTASLLRCSDSERREAVNCLLSIEAHHILSTVQSHLHAGDVLVQAVRLNGDENDNRGYTVLSHLLNYLLHDGSVVRICDSVLSSILSSSKTGSSVIKCLTRIGEEAKHTIQLLTPYTSNKKTKAPPTSHPTRSEIASTELWTSYKHKSYDEWLRNVTSSLTGSCNSDLLKLLSPICKVKTSFCDLVLPFIIHDLLEKGDYSLRDHLSRLFTGIIKHILGQLQRSDGDIAKLRRVISTLLHIVQYLRTQKYSHYRPPDGSRSKHSAWHDNFWLDVDYSLLAEAAIAVKDYHVAALYGEIKYYRTSEIDASVTDKDIQPLMIRVYSALDNTDMLYGWGVNKLSDHQSRLAHYCRENDWSKELSVRDSLIASTTQTGGADGFADGLECLRSSGLTQLLDTFLQTVQEQGEDNSEQCRDMRYEQAWKCTQWGKIPTVTRLNDSLSMNECLYMTGKAIHNSDHAQTSTLLSHMREHCEKNLMSNNLSITEPMHESLSQLKLVSVLRQISKATSQTPPESVTNLISAWKRESQKQEMMSPVFSQSALNTEDSRLTLCSLLMTDNTREDNTNSSDIGEYLVDTAVSLSQRCRISGLSSKSEQLMRRFRSRHSTLWDTRCDLEQAMIFWSANEPDRAMHIVNDCMKILEPRIKSGEDDSVLTDCKYYSQALRTYGSWLSETKSERPDTITDKYLITSVEMAERAGDVQELESAYHTLADFADAEYERLKAYMKSPEFINKLALQKIQQEQAGALSKLSGKQAASSGRYRKNLQVNRDLNEAEISSIREGYCDNMRRAMYNYIETIRTASQHDVLSVSRIVSIWFDNETLPDIQSLVKDNIPGSIPTHKFIPLMIQLSARLCDEPSHLQTVLSKLILKTAREHPHHVIPILFSLKCAASDVSPGKQVAAETKSRAKAATQILKQIGTANPLVIRQYGTLSDALIELAYAKVDEKLPSGAKLGRIPSLDQTHVLTHNLKPRPSCDYSSIPTVYKYDSTCKSAGGVNEPKIIVCIGSDGHRYKQLCKGRDDTRQDAVMQQVFSLVNELLRCDQSARALNIRTYKIIPLSQRSGLLEWCEGTIPMGVWLGAQSKDTAGAHGRYTTTKGWSVQDCRIKLAQLQKKGGTEKELSVLYNKVCDNLKPVMRHFFFEKFREAQLWSEARENYSRSVAVTSIVGYILGIGDRHSNNILIDEKTGELIHIDFGIAFEQGKALPTAEIIPFRLTRDIVDGFGPTGVNGTFKRCCEKTLHVLRGSEKVINTILQVLIDDPLLDWTLSAEKLDQKQRNQARGLDSTLPTPSQSTIPGTQQSGIGGGAGDVSVIDRTNHDTNKHQQAENALLTIRHKLRGYELNSQLSVRGQVEFLIQQATDPFNLSKMFHGWQAYL